MIAYILKSSLSLLLLFGLYWFLLRREKLFIFNRYFLIISILFSLVIPFISFHVNIQTNETPRNIITLLNDNLPTLIYKQVPITEISIQQSTEAETITEAIPAEINISQILLFVYFLGLILLLFRFTKNILIISRQIRLSESINFSGKKLVLIDNQINPYCFFNTIFVCKHDYLNNKIAIEFLTHELEHIRQSHSIDIIILELIRLVYWFNPILFLYSRAIRVNHEYLADSGVLGDSLDKKNYMDKLLSLISYRGTVPLTSSFNHSLMKKRLIMMTKSKPSKVNVGIRIFMTLNFAIVFFLLMSFKNSNAQPLTSGITYEVPGSSEQVTKDVKGFVVNKYGKYLQGIPIIVSGKNTGITTDNMGRFIISNVPEDASLTFSSKGYISQTIKPAFSSEMVVKLVLAQENLDPVNLAMDFVPSPGTNPLIVIDGVIEERVSMADIDPYNGVSSIIVLKGKDASDKYGEIGKNGIIEILTIEKSSIPSENKIPVSSATESEKPLGKRLLVVDGIVSTKELSDIPVEEIKILRSLSKWSATDKYGEKGNNGAIEIITKKKDPKSGNLLLDPLNTSSDTVNQEVTYSAAGDIDVEEQTTSETNKVEKLLVVDGVVSTKKLNDIPVVSIQIFRVLGKFEATNKYGEKGKNGVIEIITKKKDAKSGNLLLDPLNPSSNTVNQEVTYSAAGDIDVDNTNKVVKLIGSAIVKYRDIEINADSIIINTGTNSIFAAGIKDASGIIRGTPVFKEGSQEFEADEITYNLETHKALIKNIKTQEQKTINDSSANIKKDTINRTITRSFYYPNPLLIVDGIQHSQETNDNNTLLKLYAPSIKRIQLFKGDKQVKIYGDKARSGVILVTTKSGTSKYYPK